MSRAFARPKDSPSLAHRTLRRAEAADAPRQQRQASGTSDGPAGAALGDAAGAGADAGAQLDEAIADPLLNDPMEPFPLEPDELPRHVAIIMDGNRRWARQRGLDELRGHAAGVEGIRPLLRHVVKRGVPVLSLYAFSRENWARSDEEVASLFGLLEQVIRNETDELVRQGVHVRLLGRLDELPEETRRSIREALEATDAGDRLQLNIAFNYSGRTEIVDACRRLVERGLRAEEVDEEAIAGALYTAGQPDPDLVIRTGGEYRLSNFLLWQAAYAEIYCPSILWPDFGPRAFDEALLEFARRHRRFGL